MFLDKIRLINFKNYKDTSYTFSSGINCILGPNGCGKTTLLDAIHYLSMTKSALNGIDSQNIKNGEDAFSIKGNFSSKDQSDEISCIVYRGKKKTIRLNSNDYEKISDHIGFFPVVLISPDDILLINEGSEIRRRFFDSIISQVNRAYLEILMQYHQLLKQRNGFLRYSKEKNNHDLELLETYDPRLIDLSQKIHNHRLKFLKRFRDPFNKEYSILSGSKESSDIDYVSDVGSKDFAEKFINSRRRDLESQRTNLGIHRDKWNFLLDKQPLKTYGSQGQKKTYFLALKLTQFEFILKETKKLPVLLLDDIFDKLDDQRIEKLMDIVSRKNKAQTLITDARPERTENILSKLNFDANIISVDLNHEEKD